MEPSELQRGGKEEEVKLLDWVWYETETYIPSGWNGQRVFLRVNDATYAAKIWINGKAVGFHEGCHVPFAFDISVGKRWKRESEGKEGR